MQHKDIFERERAGEIISLDDPEYGKIAELITEAQKVIAEMNTAYRTPDEVRDLFSRLTGAEVDPSFWMLPPFYTDFGKNIAWPRTCSSITVANSWTGAGLRWKTTFL